MVKKQGFWNAREFQLRLITTRCCKASTGGASVPDLTYNHLRNEDHRLHSCLVLSTFSLAGLSPDKITKSARGGGSFPLVNAQPARWHNLKLGQPGGS